MICIIIELLLMDILFDFKKKYKLEDGEGGLN